MAAWDYIGQRRAGEEEGIRKIEGIPARDLTAEEVKAHPEWAERLERSLEFVEVEVTKAPRGERKDRPE